MILYLGTNLNSKVILYLGREGVLKCSGPVLNAFVMIKIDVVSLACEGIDKSTS